MWHIIAIFAIVLLVVFLAVLFLPLGVEVASEGDTRRWTMILAGVHIPVPEWITMRIKRGVSNKRSHAKEHPEQKSVFKWQDLGHKLRRIFSNDSAPDRDFGLDNLRQLLDLVIRLLHILRIRVHRLHVVIASPDPAWTGMAYGMAWAIIGALPSDWPVSVEADWNSSVPDIAYQVQVTVIPIRVLAAVAGTLWKRVYA